MKRVSLVVGFFTVGIIVAPCLPFVMAYMAAVGDFDKR